MKKRTIIIAALVALLSVTAITSYARYAKTVSKTGTIATAAEKYCKAENISSLSECLIRNDSQQQLSDALNTIDARTVSVDFGSVEPLGTYIPRTVYRDITNKTSTESVGDTAKNRFTYVIENKKITEFDVDDPDIVNISFNPETGYYTFTDSLVGDRNDIVTTETDIENGIYKYTCLNDTANGNCNNLHLYTELPYLIEGSYRYKQGYTYSYRHVLTSASTIGLYKGEDDYTTYSGNNPSGNFTYYYRGAVQNNWVSFGGFLWRVVRINGDGSIRMIYSGLASSNDHTGENALILNSKNSRLSGYGYTTGRTTTTQDISGLTTDLITTPYHNGRYGPTYVGYMYNPAKAIITFPDKTIGNAAGTRVNYFPTYNNISNTTDYYYFKNFDPSTDCFTGDGTEDTGACTLKCRSLGNDGDTGIDCVYGNWNERATNTNNYSTTADGIYPATNPTQYIYTSEYKYTCWGIGTPVTRDNGDGTTSVYVTCPLVSEIVGTIKDQPTAAKVKYHGAISSDALTSNFNVKDNNIKEQVDIWYENNILNKNDGNSHTLESYLSDAIFCNDRSSTSNGFPLTASGGSYLYGPYARNTSNTTPSLKCANVSNDGFTLKTSGTSSTVTASGVGNHMLKYPVGLITLDEAAYAGGKKASMNQYYYLCIGIKYWTMSPSHFYSYAGRSSVAYVHQNGALYDASPAEAQGIRPVINLKSTVLYSDGSGTEQDPYIITLE